ncbi:MAG TPA: phosphatase PAP2 family protein, partial [Clostridiales bacterium]|nr:phosphatase PAP2 family protein [Clostridiales bacterium]HQP70471.1 phosphatase PAP2 family protein [Clostridiales bacterium]
IDYLIPFVPEMVWIYMSTYLVIPLVGIIIEDSRDVTKLAIAIILTWLFTYPIFYFFPAVYPRPNFEIISLSTEMLNINYLHDVPNNTFPSLHVSLSFVVAFSMIHITRKNKILWALWAILIALSTVMLKKHFILDSLGGLIIAQLSFFLAFKQKYVEKIISFVYNLLKEKVHAEADA